jgi:hypothetical protein
MLGDEAFKPSLHRVRQGIVGGARIGELCIAPAGGITLACVAVDKLGPTRGSETDPARDF